LAIHNLISEMKVLLLLTLLSFTFLFSTCVDPFDPDIDGEGRKLVVDGLITNLPDAYTVRLTYSEPYNNDSLTLPVTNATVYITDDLNKRFDLSYTRQGNYVTDTTKFQGEAGKTYTLHIRTPDGKTYESQPEKMQAAPKIDTIFARFVEQADSRNVKTRYFEAYLRTTDPSDVQNFYQWRTAHYKLLEWCAEIYEFRLSTIFLYYCCQYVPCWDILRCRGNDCVQVENDAYFNGNTFEYYIARIPFDSKEDYFLSVDQLALSESTYRYWNTINKQLNNTGGIFDVPPAAAIGNVANVNDPNEIVLGIFNVAGATRKGVHLERAFADAFPDPKVYAFPRREAQDCKPCEESASRTGKTPQDWRK